MSIAMVMKEGSAGPSGASPKSDAVTALHAGRFAGVVRPYSTADVERLRGTVRVTYTLAELGARRLWELLHSEDYVPALGALTGNQAVQMVRAGSEGHLPVGLAGRRRRQHRRPDVPGPEPLPGRQRADRGAQINQALAARRPDRARRGEARARLAGAHRGRCRGRLRRPAERLRADEGDDRGRAPPAFTSRTSSPRRRSAATWAARCWSPPASSSAR